MPVHNSTSFETFLSQLQQTNQTLDFFCDFEKIGQNVDNIKLSLNMLNSLIGAQDLRTAVETLWARDREAFSVMGILIAVRDSKKVLTPQGECVKLDTMFESVDRVMEFLNHTGLADIFINRKVQNLVDYVFGIETGLDSNARKNRSGHIMEDKIAEIFTLNNITFRKEVYSKEWPEIAKVLGKDNKRFDFVIETSSKKYLIEVNFYSDGGSKLNEVARSYSDIGPKINSVEGFEFVWITDGRGWNSAKTKLQEAYNIIPSIYNLTTITNFITSIQQ